MQKRGGELLPNYAVINKIREVSLSSNNQYIHTKVFSEYQLQALKDFFGSNEALYARKINIPIDKIVALSRKHDAWYDGDTWLDIVQQHLHGTDWNDAVFDYCESSLFEKEFPAPGARGYLELTSYNGLALCDNGNHRLPAMICWLASKYNHKYELKDVSVNLIPFNNQYMKTFKTFYSDLTSSIYLFIGELKDYQKELFDVTTSQIFFMDNKLYALSESAVQLIFEKRDSSIDRIKRMFYAKEAKIYEAKKKQPITDLNDEHEKERWIEIPNYLLIKLFDDTWFNNTYLDEKDKQ
jgi:hypothetical protein